jgi:hypothetical protein
MAWDDRIFRYCERGADPGFWAEPLNAATNAAFILAAAAAAVEMARKPAGERPPVAEAGLVALVFVVGTGSFLFHTYATRWAAAADTIPIGIFMLAYLAYALRAYLGLGWVWVAAGLAAFIGALRVAGDVRCPGLLSVTDAAQGPCLNGTAGYVPAFLAMAAVALVLALRRHPAWPWLAAGSAVFLASMIFRTVDIELCATTDFAGRRLGTHFLWHVLNATMLYLLLVAAIRHGGGEARRG